MSAPTKNAAMLRITLSLLLSLIGASANEQLQVQTSSGIVEGIHSSHVFGDVVEYLGVPFAAPPVGSLRFMPPQPHSGWNGVLETKQYGAACAQNSFWTGSPVFAPLKDYMPTRFEEDCLFLNIHVPGGTVNRTKRLAVLVYIHGGNFVFGCSNIYRGDVFAAKEEVIIVSINYRVNYFGFLTTGDDRIPGNMGFLDQVHALKWIQDNIANFGGDPERVTLLGESAGAWSTSLHLVSPLSKGLFNSAILMSGVVYTRKHADRSEYAENGYLDTFLEATGCKGADDIVKCVQDLSADAILKSGAKGFDAPILDGESGFLPKEPADLWEDKNTNVNTDRLLAGTVRHDGEVMNRLLREYVKYDYSKGTSIEQVRSYVHDLLIFFDYRLATDGFSKEDVELENIIVDQYVENPEDMMANLLAVLELFTDSVFVTETRKALNVVKNQGGQGWLYYHTHKGTLSPSGFPIEVGPFHAEGIHYLFGVYVNEELPLYDANAVETNDVAKALMRGFSSFAKTGSPVVLASGDTIEWPSFNEFGDYVEFESDLGPASVKRHLLLRAVNFWSNIVPKVKKPCPLQTLTTDNPTSGSPVATSNPLLFILSLLAIFLWSPFNLLHV